MKYFIFIATLLTILSVFLIATPTEAADVATLEAGFPVVIPKQAKREFSNVIKAQILKKVDLKNLTAIKVKGLKRKVVNSINLESFVNTTTNATSLVELKNILLTVTQSILDPISTIVTEFGITNSSVIIDGVSKNVAIAKTRLVKRIESQSCNKTETSCKKIVADIITKVL